MQYTHVTGQWTNAMKNINTSLTGVLKDCMSSVTGCDSSLGSFCYSWMLPHFAFIHLRSCYCYYDCVIIGLPMQGSLRSRPEWTKCMESWIGVNDKSVSWIPKYCWNIKIIEEKWINWTLLCWHLGLECREPWLRPLSGQTEIIVWISFLMTKYRLINFWY